MESTGTPIRVGILTKPLDNWTTGSGHHLDEILHHVLDIVEAEQLPLEFTFIHYTKSDNPIYGRVKELLIPRNPLRASRIIKKHNFDVVHYSPVSIFAPIWGISTKKSATVHGIEEAIYPEGYTRIERLHALYILPWYMRRMDCIATVSNTSKNYYCEHFHIDPKKIVITTNGIGKEYKVLSDGEKTIDIDSRIIKPFILHISRYSARKNPVAILTGFASFLRSTGLDYQLVCAGKGWDCEAVTQLAEAQGIADRIVTPGFVTEKHAAVLLNNASVFVFPSFAEGFGMPNVEAMACGCPVITSNSFAIPEIVGDAALVLEQVEDAGELALAIEKIATESDFREQLVKKGLARIVRYSWDDSARVMVEMFMRLGRKSRS